MLLFLVVMVAVAAVMLVLHLCQILCCSNLSFHGLQQLLTGQFAPGSSDQRGLAVMFTQQCHSSIQLGLRNGIGTGEDDSRSSLDLIIIEFSKILHIHLDLTCIRNCHSAAQNHIISGDPLNGCDHIGQLAHTGGLNNDTVRVIAVDDLHQCLSEIAHQAAANAPGIHLRDVDTRILQKAAVNTDLAELIFNENKLLTAVGFLNHFLDQSGLAGSKETGIYVNNSHSKHLLYKFIRFIITPKMRYDKGILGSSPHSFDKFPLDSHILMG